ncbi:hypothetical protein FJ958_05110 [Mesorhizobium sp. B2-3-5]|nr:hypothetical protein FJ958_05110 [Mesorhizobium sp. B2-3-5]
MSGLYGAPLCPAGHLPRKGGDRLSSLLSPIANAAERTLPSKLPISPLAGEMSGRTEGGVTERRRWDGISAPALRSC